jgi:hypothetical protein
MVFNATLAYKLYNVDMTKGLPYGVYNVNDVRARYNDGIGESAYREICEFFNIHMDNVVSTEGLDVFTFEVK